jgi:hypothetical protein
LGISVRKKIANYIDMFANISIIKPGGDNGSACGKKGHFTAIS